MMNKNNDSEIISKEITELLSSFDKFIFNKNTIIDEIKSSFLKCSNNN